MKWLRHKFQPCIPLGADGRTISGSAEHIELSRKAAQEGIVLLKNYEQKLPFKRGQRIVLLGKASEEYIKGGGGSGDVSSAYVRTLYEALHQKQEEKKLELYSGLHDFYVAHLSKQYDQRVEPGMTKEAVLSEEELQKAATFSDTAILTICRFSGEGWDRRCEQEKEFDSEGCETWEGESILREMGKAVFQRGDFYLSEEEQQLLDAAKQYFSTIIVVLNVGGVVDTEWFYKDNQVKGALLAGQGGMEGAVACADILCGDVTPCGKLTDTFAEKLEDYPSTVGFHDSATYVEYAEDIYVGYRYFETIPGQQGKVHYPFGFGLSYTTFSYQVEETIFTEHELKCSVKVCNTGSYAGKEVIQLYVSAPQGKLGKPVRQLTAFAKTRLMQPGEEMIVLLTVPLQQLASYDDIGAVCKSAWVMEKGRYSFYLGTSVRDTVLLTEQYILDEDKVVEQLSEKCKPVKLTKRMRADGSYEALECGEYPIIERPSIFDTPEVLEGIAPEVRFEKRLTLQEHFSPSKKQFEEVAEGKLSLEAFIEDLSIEEQVWLLGGQPSTGVANTFGMGNNRDHGIPSIMTADGPAGLRLLRELKIYTTAWPCATTLASTWNVGLLEQVGAAAARELKENNIGIWLAPGMNIHRSPLCGRNFEYYSEDPLLAGEMGAAMIKGIQSEHIAATPKHFALNNKETNRKHSDSRVSERAIREIYLKGFEIAVKKADPWMIMTSYNLINGIYASENRELLTDILRGEWNFHGAVTTDWWTRAEHWREVKAGNDVKMANGYPEELLEALEDGRLEEEDVKRCAKRVLEMILKME